VLDRDLEAGAHEARDRIGDERDPALARCRLTEDGDSHDATLREGIGSRTGNLRAP
jgi:hypothetical protein